MHSLLPAADQVGQLTVHAERRQLPPPQPAVDQEHREHAQSATENQAKASNKPVGEHHATLHTPHLPRPTPAEPAG